MFNFNQTSIRTLNTPKLLLLIPVASTYLLYISFSKLSVPHEDLYLAFENIPTIVDVIEENNFKRVFLDEVSFIRDYGYFKTISRPIPPIYYIQLKDIKIPILFYPHVSSFSIFVQRGFLSLANSSSNYALWLKIPSFFAAILTILGVYLLSLSIFKERFISLVSACLYSLHPVYFLHLQMVSPYAFFNIFFVVWTLYFMIRYFESKGKNKIHLLALLIFILLGSINYLLFSVFFASTLLSLFILRKIGFGTFILLSIFLAFSCFPYIIYSLDFSGVYPHFKGFLYSVWTAPPIKLVGLSLPPSFQEFSIIDKMKLRFLNLLSQTFTPISLYCIWGVCKLSFIHDFPYIILAILIPFVSKASLVLVIPSIIFFLLFSPFSLHPGLMKFTISHFAHITPLLLISLSSARKKLLLFIIPFYCLSFIPLFSGMILKAENSRAEFSKKAEKELIDYLKENEVESVVITGFSTAQIYSNGEVKPLQSMTVFMNRLVKDRFGLQRFVKLFVEKSEEEGLILYMDWGGRGEIPIIISEVLKNYTAVSFKNMSGREVIRLITKFFTPVSEQ